MNDPATFAFYQERAAHYTQSFAQAHSRHLDRFLDRLTLRAEILEIGCGAGQDAARMKARGFRVHATDGVPAMVTKANEQFGLDARVMRFDQLNASERYDAVWAHACLLHCSRTQLPTILRAIYRALRPGGYHFASYKLGDGEGRDLFGRLHNLPSAEWVRARYAEVGFDRVDHLVYPGKGSDGTQRDWIAITVRKP